MHIYIYIHSVYIYLQCIYINTLYMQKPSTIVCMYRWWTDGRIDGWTDGLMNKWTDGWMYGCMDGWMYGCMHLRVRRNYMYICKKNYIHTYIYIYYMYIYIFNIYPYTAYRRFTYRAHFRYLPISQNRHFERTPHDRLEKGHPRQGVREIHHPACYK